MADYMTAEIVIGGSIPMRLLAELCRQIREQGVSTDDDQGPFEPNSAEELLDACRDVDGVRLLWMWDVEAHNGEFSALEAYLQENGISYRRQSDSKYEHDAEVVEYRPSTGLVHMRASKSGEALVPLSVGTKALTLMDELKAMLEEHRVPDAQQRLQSGLEALRTELPPVVPPLEPFSLV